MANSVDPDQTGSTQFASMLNSSVMLGNYLQQTTFFQMHFFLGALSVSCKKDQEIASKIPFLRS